MPEKINPYRAFNTDEEMKGILYMLLASFLFSCMGFFIKKLSVHHAPMEMIFFRNVVSLTLIIGSMLIFKPSNQGGKPFLLAMRGIYGFTAMFFYFFSVSVLPLATAATFSKTSPMFTAVIGGIMLKEKTGSKLWTSIIVGFIGILLILKPSGEISLLGSLAGIGCGFFAALAYATVRGLANYYDARMMVMSFSLAGLGGSSLYFIVMHFMGAPRYNSLAFIPVGIDIFYMFMLGLVAVVAQYYMSRSYFFGRVALMSTVGYSELLFSVFTGMLAGDMFPDSLSLMGIMLVGFSGILIMRARKS